MCVCKNNVERQRQADEGGVPSVFLSEVSGSSGLERVLYYGCSLPPAVEPDPTT